jgi:hypothetical protein
MTPFTFQPTDCRGSAFEALHADRLALYVNLKSLGRSSRAALRVAFGDNVASGDQFLSYIDFIEASQFYIDNLPKAIEANKRAVIWSAEISARTLVSIALDESSKKADRLAAIKELNVIYNITIIDDKGNTRAGHSLEDFYRLEASTAAAPQKAH